MALVAFTDHAEDAGRGQNALKHDYHDGGTVFRSQGASALRDLGKYPGPLMQR